MIIEKSKKFDKNLNEILDYIATDSLSKAIEFITQLEEKLLTLHHLPHKFRKSIYFNDDNIRDYIFKGYVIPYFIDNEHKKIVLLGIVKYRKHL